MLFSAFITRLMFFALWNSCWYVKCGARAAYYFMDKFNPQGKKKEVNELLWYMFIGLLMPIRSRLLPLTQACTAHVIFKQTFQVFPAISKTHTNQNTPKKQILRSSGCALIVITWIICELFSYVICGAQQIHSLRNWAKVGTERGESFFRARCGRNWDEKTNKLDIKG